MRQTNSLQHVKCFPLRINPSDYATILRLINVRKDFMSFNKLQLNADVSELWMKKSIKVYQPLYGESWLTWGTVSEHQKYNQQQWQFKFAFYFENVCSGFSKFNCAVHRMRNPFYFCENWCGQKNRRFDAYSQGLDVITFRCSEKQKYYSPLNYARTL